jgi:hypothetical protein
MILDPATRHYYRGWIAELWHGKGDTNVNYTNFDYIKTKEDAGDLWVALYEDILRYTQSWVTRVLEIATVTDSLITFTVGDSMRDSIYNYPLTVKVRVNNDWSTVYAAQDGETVEAKLVEYQANKYVLVKAVPDGGSVVVSKAPTTYIKDKTIMANSHLPDLPTGHLYNISGRYNNDRRPASGFYLQYDKKRRVAQKVLIINNK